LEREGASEYLKETKDHIEIKDEEQYEDGWRT
jgi:hypothetical protein